MRNYAASLLCLTLGWYCENALAQEPVDLTENALQTLQSRADTLVLTIQVFPTHMKPSLQHVLLHSGNLLIEPFAQYPNGHVVGGDAKFPAQAAEAVVQLAAAAGVFRQATKYYSERRQPDATTPPPPALAAPMSAWREDLTPIRPSIRLRFDTFDEHWYSSYYTTHPWDGSSEDLLRDIGGMLDAGGSALLDELLMNLQDKSDEPVSYVGSFTALRTTAEHVYVTELRLWRNEDALYGVLFRMQGLNGDTPIDVDRIILGGIEADGEFIVAGSQLSFLGRLENDRIEGRTQDGETLALSAGSELLIRAPEVSLATVGEIDEWVEELGRAGLRVLPL